MKGWLLQLPAQYHQRAHNLFNRHGLTALLIGRFLGFVRTLLPTMAGISGLNSSRFGVQLAERGDLGLRAGGPRLRFQPNPAGEALRKP